jgi:hypothetical protein
MRLILCAILVMVSGLCKPVLAEPRPAGYIMAYELKGADAESGTVVVRDGKELPPKLLMPLYNNDSVFIRDEASRVTLSLAHEGNLVVSGNITRKEIAGEMPSGDDGFDIIAQIAGILFGHGQDDDSLSVLVAKGDNALKAPLAVHGRNYILRSGSPLRVEWAGGEGPFAVLIDEGRGGTAKTQADRAIDVPLATISSSKFTVVVTDAQKRKLRIAFELRKARPKAPDNVTARENSGEVEAIWLAAQQNGAWRFEALRQLRALPRNDATAGLVAALEKGWIPK